MTYHIYALFAVSTVSLISLIGAFTLSLKEELIKKYIFLLVSLATGALLGDVFIHILPESFEATTNTLSTSLFVILGILVFFVLEKFMHWHHHNDDTTEKHIHPMGKLVLLSDGIHNFIDGMIIAISFMASIPLGIATTIAVVLHEIPQEIGDFAVLLHAGYTRKKALLLNFISAIFAILGAVLVFILGQVSENLANYILPIAAGGFIYIAMSDLIPELQKTKKTRDSVLQLVSLVFGIALMTALIFLE